MTLRSLIPILFLSGSILLAAGAAIAANPDAATAAGPAATADGGLIEMNIFSELRDIVTGYTWLLQERSNSNLSWSPVEIFRGGSYSH